MSLQRRLLLYLLVCAPLVWGVALYFSISRARHEVNELFDTELIRLARQVQSTLGPSYPLAPQPLPPAPAEGSKEAGQSDVRDLAVAVWDAQGRLMLADREGAQLTYRPEASGFTEEKVNRRAWRVYYLPSSEGKWLVAAGQAAYERDELVYGLTVTQVVPWLLLLPILLAAMAWAVRRALSPVHQLTSELAGRKAEDLRPIPDDRAPAELKPLLGAMNGLFARIEQLLLRERRFTADAAHEMRTPLAVLRAQWDVVRRSTSAAERAQAEAKLSAGLDRMGRLVTQMLSLSRVESGGLPALASEVQWQSIVEQVMSDCLALAERRRIELACEWPPRGIHPLPLLGDEHLLTVLLRNLLDNAVRYAPPGTTVVLRFGSEHLEVENDGPALSSEQLARLGERFYRPDGQHEGGSGLGVSIVRRIAQLHGLELSFETRADGQGVKAVLRFDAAHH
ncbi:MAG TPA: ATP-binding protein [Ramlibacter sp.]|nr:ATP-binding protein [Ramlibacter sp.]